MAYRSDRPANETAHETLDVFVPRWRRKALLTLGAAAIALIAVLTTLNLQSIQLRCERRPSSALIACSVQEVFDGRVRRRLRFEAHHVSIELPDNVADVRATDVQVGAGSSRAAPIRRFLLVADDAMVVESFRLWNTDAVERVRQQVYDWQSRPGGGPLLIRAFSRTSLLFTMAGAMLAFVVIGFVFAMSRLGARLTLDRGRRMLRLQHRSFFGPDEAETWQLSGLTDVECEPEGARAYLVLRYGLSARSVLQGPWSCIEQACTQLRETLGARDAGDAVELLI